MSVRTTQIAIERLAGAPPNVHERMDVLRAWIDLGEALRLGLEIPKTLREWMTSLERPDVEATLLAAMGEDVKERTLEDFENVERALLRIVLTKKWNPAEITHFERLRKILASKSHSTNGGGGDQRRGGMKLDGGGASPVTVNEDGSHVFALSDGSVSAAVPDDDIVDSYIRRGAMARYVEGVARQNASFQEELMACIEASIEANEPVGETAHAWRTLIKGGAVRAVRAVEQESSSSSSSSNEEGTEGKKKSLEKSRDAKVIAITRSPVAVAENNAKRWRFISSSIALAAALVLSLGGYSMYSSSKESERIQAVKDRDIADKQAQLDRLMNDLKLQQEAIAAAQAEAANAKSDADRANAQAKLSAAQEKQRQTQTSIGAVKSSSQKGGNPRPACTCQMGDPLCSCL